MNNAEKSWMNVFYNCVVRFIPAMDGLVISLILIILLSYSKTTVHRQTKTTYYSNGVIKTESSYDSLSQQVNCSITRSPIEKPVKKS